MGISSGKSNFVSVCCPGDLDDFNSISTCRWYSALCYVVGLICMWLTLVSDATDFVVRRKKIVRRFPGYRVMPHTSFFFQFLIVDTLSYLKISGSARRTNVLVNRRLHTSYEYFVWLPSIKVNRKHATGGCACAIILRHIPAYRFIQARTFRATKIARTALY